jgi:hypothetical protein
MPQLRFIRPVSNLSGVTDESGNPLSNLMPYADRRIKRVVRGNRQIMVILHTTHGERGEILLFDSVATYNACVRRQFVSHGT